MPRRLDLTGNIYGEWMVVEMLYGYRLSSGKPRTYCRCCSQDGEEVIIRADALQSGATKSKKAGRTGKMIDITGMRFGLLMAIHPTNKRAANGSIIWVCLCDCGNYVEVPIGQLMRGHTLSCGCWHQSKWEMFIRDFLISLNVAFQPQKRFNDCRNKQQSHTLPFDFYLPDYNICIEYDGEQHFKPVNFGGVSDDKAKENLLITQQNDGIKTQYCQDHNIILLRIPYAHSKEDIENEILNILSPVKITA